MSEDTNTQDENTPTYNVGDEITVMRGNNRNKVATVKGVDRNNKRYSVEYLDGSFDVITFVNTKPPVQGTITAGALASVIKTNGPELENVIAALVKTLDGFAKAMDSE